jgi:ATP-dependent exoDNAse (exonuclease V) beta subunit
MLEDVLRLECFKNIASAKVYKEHEFMYEKDGNLYHGIVDLLVEYDDHYEIIDYKLSDIDKEEYIIQLNEYYKYLSLITNKKIKMYLLSLTKAKLKEVNVLK